MEVVARRGFDATVREIADASGVSPRTIFRYYSNHDQLVATTVKDIFEACGLPILFEGLDEIGQLDHLVENWPLAVDDLDSAIDVAALTFHTRSAEILGAAFWDIHAPRSKTSEALAEVDELRREYRLRAGLLLNLAWHTAGGVGEPPEALQLAFALHFSSFTTQALMIDFDQTPAQIGALTADIFKVLLRRAVHDQRRVNGTDSSTAG
jgi:AcrR family transcriptional regulator